MSFNLRRNWIVKSLQNGSCILLTGLLAVGSPVMAGEPVEIRSSDVALNAGQQGRLAQRPSCHDAPCFAG